MVEVIYQSLEWDSPSPTPNTKRFKFTSDASGSWGYEAWYNNSWFSLPWTESCTSLHITVKEMTPIIIAAIIWGHDWRDAQVTAFCDNAAVVAALNNKL